MTDRSPKVCYIVNDLTQTTAVFDLAPAILNYTSIKEVGILAWFESNIDSPPHSKIQIHKLNADRSSLGLSPGKLYKARKIIKQYDIIQVHHFPSDIYSKLLSLDKMTIVRDGNHHKGYKAPIRLTRGLSNISVDSIICVSDSVAESYKRWEDILIIGDKNVVYSGIELEDISNVDSQLGPVIDTFDGSLMVGHVGKLEYQKNQKNLIKAVFIAYNRYDLDVELVIAGDGSLGEELQGLVNNLGIEDRVHFLGLIEREEVYSLLQDIDVFAMPSRWEGFCIAVLQAMASGTPCVLSEIEAFERPFSEDEAVFVPVDDAVAIAETFNSLAENQTSRERYGERARELVISKYSATQMAKGYSEIYYKLYK